MPKVLRKIKDDCVVVLPDGDIAGADAASFSKLILQAAPEESRLVILDLSRVDFVDSRGIGVLVKLNRSLQSRGQGVALAGLNAAVASTVERTRVDSIFQVFTTADEAADRHRLLVVALDTSDPGLSVLTLKGVLVDATEQELSANLDRLLKLQRGHARIEASELWHAAPAPLKTVARWVESMVKEDRRVYIESESGRAGVFDADPLLKDLLEPVKSGERPNSRHAAGAIGTYKHGDYPVVKVSGGLTGDAVAEFAAAVSPAALKRPKGLILELSEVTEIESRGIGALIKAVNDMKLFQARVAVIRPRPRIGRILSITGVSRMVNEFSEESDAVKGLEELGPARG